MISSGRDTRAGPQPVGSTMGFMRWMAPVVLLLMAASSSPGVLTRVGAGPAAGGACAAARGAAAHAPASSASSAASARPARGRGPPAALVCRGAIPSSSGTPGRPTPPGGGRG
jgi:hypothetical protein